MTKKVLIKYLDWVTLKDLNKKSIKEKRNQNLNPGLIWKLSADKIFPVSFLFVHNDKEYRLGLNLGLGYHSLLDIDLKDYRKLKTVNMPSTKITKTGTLFMAPNGMGGA